MKMLVVREAVLSKPYKLSRVGRLVNLPANRLSQCLVKLKGVKRTDIPADWEKALHMADNTVLDRFNQEMVIREGQFAGLYRSPTVFFRVDWRKDRGEAIGSIVGQNTYPPPLEVQKLFSQLPIHHEVLIRPALEPSHIRYERMRAMEAERKAQERQDLFKADPLAWCEKYGSRPKGWD